MKAKTQEKAKKTAAKKGGRKQVWRDEDGHRYTDKMVIDALVKLVEGTGLAPWNPRVLRFASDNPCVNMNTGRPYSGMNAVFLSMMVLMNGWDSDGFLTASQIQKRGGGIREGEKPSPVFFYHFPAKKQEEEEAQEDGKAEEGQPDKAPWRGPTVRVYLVYNMAQTTGIGYESQQAPSKLDAMPFEPITGAQDIVDGYADGPAYLEGAFGCGSYCPADDMVRMPVRTWFDDPQSYYRTLFHELGHSTGHPKRLDRELGQKFGSSTYAREELTAEVTAGLLCARCGIDGDLENSAAYLDSWIRHVRTCSSPSGLLMSAFSRAQKAAALIVGDAAGKE